ncbi:transposon Ty3-G Gag-Pol polyprotein [Elysia marginata]|uniref:Transposon Ty3-G Gag-Pol polyprotein n=1 Tax=Elysia marginata TaxID=1093978 RepID=A0AAV4EXM7_9GAST|nr:transposon Ty3-G Gag-Pol polyprotein [Elysia marginata]
MLRGHVPQLPTRLQLRRFQTLNGWPPLMSIPYALPLKLSASDPKTRQNHEEQVREDEEFKNPTTINSRAAQHWCSINKLPEFWTTSPEVWFARVEAQFGTKNITTDQTKYDYVVSALDVKTAEEVQDVLVNPPDTNKYITIKTALLKAFGKSQAQRDSELLNLNGLGDRKPTALLRKINALNDDPQTLKRALFLSNLPSDIRSILAGQDFIDIGKLAEAADRIWETRGACVQHIVTHGADSPPPTPVEAVSRPKYRLSGRSYLVDTGAEVSVYPASVQERKFQPASSSLTAANGTSIPTWGKRNVSLAIGHKGQYNHEFYLADVTRPILGADFFTKHGIAIDLRGKRLLSLDNIPILLRETRSPLTLAGLGFPLPSDRFRSLHVDLVGPLPESHGMTYLFTTMPRHRRKYP